MLEAGGNAVDAAIAANAVLGLTQPYVNGMGGDLFAIVYEAKTGKVYGLNSSGWTPKALTIDYLKGQEHHQARQPGRPRDHGARAAWPAGTRCGNASAPSTFPELLASAIFYAENGFPLPEIGARSWITQALLKQAGLQGDLHAGRRAAATGRRLQESGARRIAAPGRREGPRRLLQGQARRE